ncbi:MAG: fluoride efflux transporter CrcB [Chitinophagaceae bacterium]|nr:fluoride efflux transporter CrcB [Chitinophagaceae bacterium]
MLPFVYVFIGGGLGSVLRYGISLAITAKEDAFPKATFITNIAGCLLIGLVLGYLGREHTDNTHWKLLLATGFCGGFTTFSSFSREALNLMQQQQWGLFAIYVILSVLICIAATAGGFALIKSFQ